MSNSSSTHLQGEQRVCELAGWLARQKVMPKWSEVQFITFNFDRTAACMRLRNFSAALSTALKDSALLFPLLMYVHAEHDASIISDVALRPDEIATWLVLYGVDFLHIIAGAQVAYAEATTP